MSVPSTADYSGVSNSMIESSSSPIRRQISVGVREYLIGVKTLAALSSTSASVMALEEDTVENRRVISSYNGLRCSRAARMRLFVELI